MIILDSDIFTLLTYQHGNVVRHYEAVPDDEHLAVTAVTRAEILRERIDSLLKAANEQELMTATRRLQATEDALNDFLVIHVDEEAAKYFQALLGQKKLKMRRPDMLIACIALANDALLATRNTKDFKPEWLPPFFPGSNHFPLSALGRPTQLHLLSLLFGDGDGAS